MYYSMPGVMLSKVFPWYFHQMLLLDQIKISELGSVVESGDIEHTIGRRETDAVEVSGKLFF